MNCKHVNNLLSQYAANDLPTHVQTQVQSHLDGDAHCKPCAICAARLTMLQHTLALLQADAQPGPETMPDLYAAFCQRLATQPVRRGLFASLHQYRQARPAWNFYSPRTAVIFGTMGLAGSLLSILESYLTSLYPAQKEAQFFELEAALRQSHNGPLHTLESMQGLSEKHGGGYVFEHWFKNNYDRSTATFYNAPPTKTSGLKTHWTAQDQVWQQHSHYYTPGAVMLQWDAPTSYNPRSQYARLSVPSSEPSRDTAEYYRKNITRPLSNVLSLLTAADKLNSVSMQTSYATINGRRVKKVYIWNLDALLGAKRVRFDQAKISTVTSTSAPKQTASKTSTPDRIAVWLDAQNRIYYEWDYYVANDGTQWASDSQIDYDLDANAWIMEPHLPPGMPIVAEEWSAKSEKADYPPNQRINPVWLTMSSTEKQTVQTVVKQFAQVWRTRDNQGLHSLVDTQYPIELTRPERRKHITGEDVWHRDWQKKIAAEPQWGKYQISFDFAFQADKRLFDTPPFDLKHLCTDTVLPGLNIPAWVRATRQDGTSVSYAANLYLIKRTNGWKVYQYERD